MNKKPFIVFEGLDGAGKSTQIHILSSWLSHQGIKNIRVREPGSTMTGEKIRTLLKTIDMTDQARLLLFNACRNLLLEKLSHYKDHWILCDRYKPSTWAYQHYGKGLDASIMTSLDNMHHHNLEPDLVIYLDTHDKTILTPRDELEKISRDKVKIGYQAMIKPNWLVVQPDTIVNTSNIIIDRINRMFGERF